MFSNKSILVTGGTGSFGQKFIDHILHNYPKIKKVIIFSRDEFKQHLMQEKYKQTKFFNKLRFFLGDLRDKERLAVAFEDVNLIIHAAALKQVPAAEYNPIEFIKTNVLGTQNLVECAIKSGVDKVVALSTDKACSPINLYGATKLCADKLVTSANNITGNRKISLSVVRYGNVINSRGSVVPLLLDQKSNKQVFTITDKKMTRFSITLKEGVDAVIWAIKNCIGGEIVVPQIPSYDLSTLIKAIDDKNKVKIIGIRHGEKMHEEMIIPSDSHLTVKINKYFLIAPNNNIKDKLIKKYKAKNVKNKFHYKSDTNSKFLSVNELRKIISDETGYRLI
jgi:UDP-N-acetylglucosamine 4,6-dehydratase (inverting)